MGLIKSKCIDEWSLNFFDEEKYCTPKIISHVGWANPFMHE